MQKRTGNSNLHIPAPTLRSLRGASRGRPKPSYIFLRFRTVITDVPRAYGTVFLAYFRLKSENRKHTSSRTPPRVRHMRIASSAMTQLHPVQNASIMMITTNVLDRQPLFANASYAREAIECLYRVQALYPFFLYAFVIMPDHCHFLVRVPAPETIGRIMNSYKSGLTFDLGIPKLWQRRYHLRLIAYPDQTKNYIHQNAVAAGLVECAEDYPWSSASGRWDITELLWE